VLTAVWACAYSRMSSVRARSRVAHGRSRANEKIPRLEFADPSCWFANIWFHRDCSRDDVFLGELEFSWPTGRLEINIDILLKRSILDFGGKNGHPLLRMHRSQTAIATRKPVGAILSSVHGGIIHFHRFGMDTCFGLEKCRPLRHFEGTGSQRCGAQHGSAQLKFIVSLNR
jgi:hypothetical protein